MNKDLHNLRLLALAENRRRHPTFPEYARHIRKYSDKTANELTRCIIDWLRLNDWQAERTSVTGRYLDQSRIVTDVMGDQRKIGRGRWIPSSGQRGSADISATINGLSVKIEVKIGKDRQSPAQVEYQKQVEASGGLYFIARDFASFVQFYETLITKN